MPVEFPLRPLKQRPIAAAFEGEQAIEDEEAGMTREVLALVEIRLVRIAPPWPGQRGVAIVLEGLEVHDVTVQSFGESHNRFRAGGPHTFPEPSRGKAQMIVNDRACLSARSHAIEKRPRQNLAIGETPLGVFTPREQPGLRMRAMRSVVGAH